MYFCSENPQQITQIADDYEIHGRKIFARDYAEKQILENNGFSIINIDFTGDNSLDKDKLKKGDVVVHIKSDNPSHPGHIAMWTGDQWVSDFKQNTGTPWSGATVYVYRYTSSPEKPAPKYVTRSQQNKPKKIYKR